ncbi:unnamed protein product [Rotaria magnacalcarata]|uniref:Uncharacterized protein n=1 Tax=Rotaria magnacalcarata TaxID=392030 RepID=A0A820PZB9_9BILA|nr:unnamed protein product [Rotaria magnacalcarata]
MMQQSNRTDDEQSENRFNFNSVRQLQSTQSRTISPQGARSKESAVEKKPENDHPNLARNSKTPAVPTSQSRSSRVTKGCGCMNFHMIPTPTPHPKSWNT